MTVIAVPSMAMYSSCYLCSWTLFNRSLWLLAHADELSSALGLCLWSGTVLRPCCCFGNVTLLTALKSSLPELLYKLGYCWPRELIPMQRGGLQSQLEEETSCSLQQRRAVPET